MISLPLSSKLKNSIHYIYVVFSFHEYFWYFGSFFEFFFLSLCHVTIIFYDSPTGKRGFLTLVFLSFFHSFVVLFLFKFCLVSNKLQIERPLFVS
jgi:hypothetical protein